MSSIPNILASELHQLAAELASKAPGLSAGSEDTAAECLTLCERLGQVAEMIEVPALQDLAIFLISNIPALLGQDATQGPAQLCAELELCLLEGTNSERWPLLSANLADPKWPASMDADAAEVVAMNLRPLATLGSIALTAETAPPPSLSLADLTLTATEDVGHETLAAFFQEGPQQASELNRSLSSWLKDGHADALAVAQRLAHTLKGSSALCGMHAIAHLVHAMEAVFQRSAAEDASPNTEMAERLFEAGDMVEQLLELAALGAPAPASLLEMIGALHQSQEGGESAISDASAAVEIAAEPLPPSELPSSTHAQSAPTLNVPIQLIDENLRRAGELNVGIGQLLAHASATLERANRLSQQLALVQGQVYELETLVDTRGVPALRSHAAAGAEPLGAEFDPLEMDEYTALHSLSRAFAESTLDSRELARELGDELLKFQNLISQHARLGKELSDSVMGARLVPVATIVARLERIARQTARQTGREIQLSIAGRDLSIDTDILNGLVEPLLHVLRNAIDHGIESNEERAAAGKPACGHIQLIFKREGNRIEVICRDDGRGLDFEAIARRARERGLIDPNATLSESELANLVFIPGFSTRRSVSSISGRGVGMDVVRAATEKLKGTVALASATGVGCTLTFHLPLSLTSAHALFVSVNDEVFGLPSTNVEQVLYSDAGRVLELGDHHVFEYGGRIAPLYRLAQLLGYPSSPLDELATQPGPLVLAQTDVGIAAIAVDRALDSRQVVIKGLPKMLPSIPGVAGACVLPSGAVGVIVEVRELLRQPAFQTAAVGSRLPLTASQSALQALVVDDSLSARRTLAQLLGDSGFSVATAVDGLDAIERMEERRPDIVLLDMEMPRMNGLELTAHVRAHRDWQSIPIVMITSRSADKHRTQALRAGVSEYVTKPYLDTDLLARVDALLEAEPSIQ